MTHRHSLLDVIECSWWPNDGPVHLRGAVRPIEEPLLPVPTRFGRANQTAQLQPRILRALVGHEDGLTCTEIARRLDEPVHRTNNALHLLLRKCAVEHVEECGRYSKDTRWRLADDDVAEVALDAEEAA